MQLSWVAFFMSFVATFAPAALLPIIRDDLNLTKSQLGNAGAPSWASIHALERVC